MQVEHNVKQEPSPHACIGLGRENTTETSEEKNVRLSSMWDLAARYEMEMAEEAKRMAEEEKKEVSPSPRTPEIGPSSSSSATETANVGYHTPPPLTPPEEAGEKKVNSAALPIEQQSPHPPVKMLSMREVQLFSKLGYDESQIKRVSVSTPAMSRRVAWPVRPLRTGSKWVPVERSRSVPERTEATVEENHSDIGGSVILNRIYRELADSALRNAELEHRMARMEAFHDFAESNSEIEQLRQDTKKRLNDTNKRAERTLEKTRKEIVKRFKLGM